MSYGGGYGGQPPYGGYGGPPQGTDYGYQQGGYAQGNPGGYGAPQDRYAGPPQGAYGGGPPQGGYSGGGYEGGPPQGGYGGSGGGYEGGPPQQAAPHFQHAPGGSFHPNGQKKALICGCNYAGSDCALNGCINDAHCMAYLLTSKFGFSQDNMRMLLDDNPDRSQHPTRQNMLEGIAWLVRGCQPGDSLFMHYSGHGSQSRDTSGDESDGLNETLCPTDFKQAGMIVDDELNQMLINPIPQGVRLHVVIDACHSGSVCDLEYKASVSGGQPSWKQEYKMRPRIYKGTAGGRAYQFGAATDEQTAADTNKLSGNVSTGAATFAFIQAVERAGTHISYGQLLHEMHKSLKTLGGGSSGGGMGGMLSGKGGFMGNLVNVGMQLMKSRGSGGGPDLGSLLGSLMQSSNSAGWKKQTPVLSSNEAFDFNMPIQL